MYEGNHFLKMGFNGLQYLTENNDSSDMMTGIIYGLWLTLSTKIKDLSLIF